MVYFLNGSTYVCITSLALGLIFRVKSLALALRVKSLALALRVKSLALDCVSLTPTLLVTARQLSTLQLVLLLHGEITTQ